MGREVWTIRAHYVDPATGQPRTDNILKTVGVLAGVVAAFVLAEGFDQRWAMVVAGAVLVLAVVVFSRYWGHRMVAEMRTSL